MKLWYGTCCIVDSTPCLDPPLTIWEPHNTLHCVCLLVHGDGWVGLGILNTHAWLSFVSKPNHLKDIKKELVIHKETIVGSKKNPKSLICIYLHLNKHTLSLEAQLTLTQAPSVAHLVGGERAELCRRPHSSLTAVETV